MNQVDLVKFKKHIENQASNMSIIVIFLGLIKDPSLTLLLIAYEGLLKHREESYVIDYLKDPNTDWPWTEDFQDWFVKRDKENIFNIPQDKLSPKVLKKYGYMFSLKKVGILR